MTWTDEAVSFLSREGFDERFGARPLQRTLEALVVVPLAKKLVKEPDLKTQTIQIDVDVEQRIVFRSI